MNEERFRTIVDELAFENPLAVRALLKVLEIRFTEDVPTLAVTSQERPVLLVNLPFIKEHCRTEMHVKAVIVHEFLHVLLRHTESRRPATDEEHLAMDAVINAIIHRQMGSEASSMMSEYYGKAKGLLKLLRPLRDVDRLNPVSYEFPHGLDYQIREAWTGLYSGRLVVDDIRELAEQFAAVRKAHPSSQASSADFMPGNFLGNHDEVSDPVDPALREALDETLRAMNGGGIWNAPFSRGLGGASTDAIFTASHIALARWKNKTLKVLRRHVVPDVRSTLREPRPETYALPVLTPGDRRAFVRALWSPFLPESEWKTEKQRPAGTTQIYLDVSGSMHAEMPHVIALLSLLRRYIRMPFWAFSTEVAPATIRGGTLVTKSTGGTSIECVLRHIAKSRPSSAVIVTDGYIEPVQAGWARAAADTRIHALVTRDGSTELLEKGGIAATQLEKLP